MFIGSHTISTLGFVVLLLLNEPDGPPKQTKISGIRDFIPYCTVGTTPFTAVSIPCYQLSFQKQPSEVDRTRDDDYFLFKYCTRLHRISNESEYATSIFCSELFSVLKVVSSTILNPQKGFPYVEASWLYLINQLDSKPRIEWNTLISTLLHPIFFIMIIAVVYLFMFTIPVSPAKTILNCSNREEQFQANVTQKLQDIQRKRKEAKEIREIRRKKLEQDRKLQSDRFLGNMFISSLTRERDQTRRLNDWLNSPD